MRTIRELIDLYRDEAKRSSADAELLDELFDFAKRMATDHPRLDIDDPLFDVTGQQTRWGILSEALIRALVATGDLTELEEMLEDRAERTSHATAPMEAYR